MIGLTYQGKSFYEILHVNRGVGRGFDLLRLALATLILLSHTSGIIGTSGTITAILNWIFHVDPHTVSHFVEVKQGGVEPNGIQEHALTGLGRPITLSYLPMFFALSGFLVAGSALRTKSLLPFLGLRVLRLLPALFVEVTLSAVILGGLLTTMPLKEYYTSAGFFNYFLNIIGHVQFYLPGVFEHTSRVSAVNANLWTLPWELYCYILISVLILSSLLFNKVYLTVLYAVLTAILLVASFGFGYQVIPDHLLGPTLIYYFLTGLIFYVWRDRIKYNILMFLVAVFISYCLMMFPKAVFVYPLLLTYVTIFIGLSPFPQSKILKSGDYSYGVYLYGMPVTQALIAVFPSLKNNLVMAALSALLTTLMFAFFSWHGVEKHALKLKRYLSPKSSQITAALHPEVYDKPILNSMDDDVAAGQVRG